MNNRKIEYMSPGDGYRVVPYHVEQSDGYVSPNGLDIEWNWHEKLVYSYMLQRNKFFIDNKSQHYESQLTMADNLRMSRKTVWKAIKGFIQNGVIYGYKNVRRDGGLMSYTYTKVLDIKTWRYVDTKQECTGLGNPNKTFTSPYIPEVSEPVKSLVINLEDDDYIPI